MKVCACCKIEKPITSFYKKKKSSDGYHNYCKICTDVLTSAINYLKDN